MDITFNKNDLSLYSAIDDVNGEYKSGDVPGFDDCVSLMDDDLREFLHDVISPCSQRYFLNVYKRLHYLKYGVEF